EKPWITARRRSHDILNQVCRPLSSFAATNVQHLASAVDRRHLEPQAFKEAKAAGVDERQTDAVPGAPHCGEGATDFFLAQDDREPGLPLWASHVEDRPVATERLLIEEVDPTEVLRDATRGDLADGAEVQ